MTLHVEQFSTLNCKSHQSYHKYAQDRGRLSHLFLWKFSQPPLVLAAAKLGGGGKMIGKYVCVFEWCVDECCLADGITALLALPGTAVISSSNTLEFTPEFGQILQHHIYMMTLFLGNARHCWWGPPLSWIFHCLPTSAGNSSQLWVSQ